MLAKITLQAQTVVSYHNSGQYKLLDAHCQALEGGTGLLENGLPEGVR